jgi:hypothetical protein
MMTPFVVEVWVVCRGVVRTSLQALSYEPDERGTSLIVVERAPGLLMLSVMLFAYRRYLVR